MAIRPYDLTSIPPRVSAAIPSENSLGIPPTGVLLRFLPCFILILDNIRGVLRGFLPRGVCGLKGGWRDSSIVLRTMHQVWEIMP